MVSIINQKNNWYLITVDDPHFLSGKSLYELTRIVTKVVKFRFVILDYIHGSGKDWLIYTLQNHQNKIYTMEEFLQLLLDVKQFDWGDFFLFKEYPNHWNNPKGELYPYVISQSDTTIRAVDDQYIYVYTPYFEIVELIKENYVIESIKIDLLDNLDYPD